MRHLLLLALLSLAVTACGYKGPLYLPKAPAQNHTSPAP
ncbi:MULTISPECIES: LPS translocon maturation chaperone LptM [Vogesella]|jgi:predicted small lipoprotein YifL|nr:lipoprotein [Vogesella urethralis]MEC5205746.1 putative small lipoprotein YifL [Vogesella perlucida]